MTDSEKCDKSWSPSAINYHSTRGAGDSTVSIGLSAFSQTALKQLAQATLGPASHPDISKKTAPPQPVVDALAWLGDGEDFMAQFVKSLATHKNAFKT
jgi:hypothetical protein